MMKVLFLPVHYQINQTTLTLFIAEEKKGILPQYEACAFIQGIRLGHCKCLVGP
jgi:hypothetical protein